MSTHLAPTIDTHVPIIVEMPTEPNESTNDRPDLPVPSLWQKSVQARHKVSGKVAIVVRVDWSMNMFRGFYPDEGDLDEDKKPKGRFATRTEWEHCRDWEVSVTYSPKELARQEARAQLEAEIRKLDAKGLAAVRVLCDDDDPAKALAKLEALRQLGVVKVSAEAAVEAIEQTTTKPKGAR